MILWNIFHLSAFPRGEGGFCVNLLIQKSDEGRRKQALLPLSIVSCTDLCIYPMFHKPCYSLFIKRKIERCSPSGPSSVSASADSLSLAGDGFLSRRRQTLCRIRDISLSKGVSLLSALPTFPLSGEFPKGSLTTPIKLLSSFFNRVRAEPAHN